jgi:hypothetical protein
MKEKKEKESVCVSLLLPHKASNKTIKLKKKVNIIHVDEYSIT